MSEAFREVTPDTHPIEISGAGVERVHMFDVPASLREHAHYMLGELSGNVWWSLGTFLAQGETLLDSAVCRRNERSQVEYGVEV